MKIIIILAHPNSRSFNSAIAAAAKKVLEKNGHEVIFRDLYRNRFDPNLSVGEIVGGGKQPSKIRKYSKEISKADGIIIVHPNWWGQPPAILKGWVDRVLREGIAYRFIEGDGGEGVPEGLLKAKAAMVLNTSNTFKEREKSVFGDPLELIWKNCVFGLCGVRNFYRKTFGPIVTSSLEQRKKWLKEVGDIVDRYFPKG